MKKLALSALPPRASEGRQTHMSNARIPLRIIQEISGHRNLEQLQKYLEVRPDQVRGVVSPLSTLSYVRKP